MTGLTAKFGRGGLRAVLIARNRFARVHQRGETPEEMEEFKFCVGDAAASARGTADVGDSPAMPHVVDILVDSGMAPSKSEARRLVKSGAVSIDGEKIVDARAPIPAGRDSFVLRCGKLQFRRVTLVPSKE